MLKYFVILAFIVLLVGCGENPLDGSKDSNLQVKMELPKEIIGSDGAPMALIPAGEFQMGTDPSEVNILIDEFAQWWSASAFDENDIRELLDVVIKAETPAHKVFLDAFYIDVYEVTNAQYKKFIDATGYRAPDYWNGSQFNAPNQPVVGVSWYDASAYAKWAGKRLPTEAEWEKSARGGLVGKKFPWGDQNPDGSQCNFADLNTTNFPRHSFVLATIIGQYPDKNTDDGYAETAPVGSFKPNGYGLYDMAGNVDEWCYDWYTPYTNVLQLNPDGSTTGTERVVRGGSWALMPLFLRVACRERANPDDASYNTGFRCAMDAK